MDRSRLAKSGWLLVLILLFALYFFALGRPPLLGPDEPRYAQVAREMFLRGDLVTPTLGGHTWFEKPALPYWVTMVSYALGGISEWSARFGAACSGTLCIALIAWSGKSVERASATRMEWLALASGGILATSAGIIAFSRGVNFDIYITASMTVALSCFFASEISNRGNSRRFWLAAFYLAMGAALLAKGLVGVVLPLGIVGFYFLLRGERPGSERLGLRWGWLLTIAVASTWYAPMIARHGWVFLDEFFIQHHFARYTSNRYRHPQPFYFFLPIMALLALPWSAFLMGALGQALKWNWRGDDAADRLRVFALAWLAFPVFFFSLSGSKLPGYVLPALPAAALLAGDVLARALRGETVSSRYAAVTGVLIVVLGVFGIFYAVSAARMPFPSLVPVAMPAILAGIVTILWRRRARVYATTIAGAVVVTVGLVASGPINAVAQRQSTRDLLHRAATVGHIAAPVVGLHAIDRSAEFYAAGRVLYDSKGEPIKLEGANQVAELSRRNRGAWLLVLVPIEHAGQLTGYPLVEALMIGDNGELALLAVRARE